MISVVIPIHRSHTTLLRALNSVAHASSATKTAVEIVLVFDGPDPDSLEVLNHWQSPNTITVTHVSVPHGGIARARNCGLTASRHDLVTFLDADDELTAERFSAIPRWEPRSVLIGHQKVAGAEIPGLHSSLAFSDEAPYITSMIGSRNDLIALGGFSEDFALGDDWDLLIRAKESGIAVTIQQEVWAIRHISDSNASHNTATLAKDHLAAIRAHHHRVRFYNGT